MNNRTEEKNIRCTILRLQNLKQKENPCPHFHGPLGHTATSGFSRFCPWRFGMWGCTVELPNTSAKPWGLKKSSMTTRPFARNSCRGEFYLPNLPWFPLVFDICDANAKFFSKLFMCPLEDAFSFHHCKKLVFHFCRHRPLTIHKEPFFDCGRPSLFTRWPCNLQVQGILSRHSTRKTSKPMVSQWTVTKINVPHLIFPLPLTAGRIATNLKLPDCQCFFRIPCVSQQGKPILRSWLEKGDPQDRTSGFFR